MTDDNSTDESLKKCGFSCPGDVTQACGGDGTYIAIYYDRTRYIPGPDTIPGTPPVVSSSLSVSGTSKTSTSTGTQSTVSMSSTATLSSDTSRTSTNPTTTPSQTGPAIVKTLGTYSYVGCYTEATKGRALSQKSFANDSMTIEACASTCAGYAWFGIEYRRECGFSQNIRKRVF